MSIQMASRSIFRLTSLRNAFQPVPWSRAGHRSIASEARKEFLCIVPDKPNSIEIRKQVRPKHLEAAKGLVASGKLVVGGAMLESHPMEGQSMSFKGSMLIYTGRSLEDVQEMMMSDVVDPSLGSRNRQKSYKCAAGTELNPGKDTYRNLKETGECVLNTVSENMIVAVNVASIDAPYGVSEWDILGLYKAPTTTVKPARVQDLCSRSRAKWSTSRNSPIMYNPA
ncbi:uncharacterized protein ATNIH1004_002043 [Aspergillus tanneri]|uniref:YCII-related domain-containing protein n=1 Tax=Aspergillus tanneri TaxID=1220188 RepID=A0A5M9M8Q4_9EURO|nr:uncharacterized protein ATNIH1004_002043 [Aspergillus tanneri]KAA8641303.1 hypothetical protein ATNIH1004_002043 [Aspergillus tanneri]